MVLTPFDFNTVFHIILARLGSASADQREGKSSWEGPRVTTISASDKGHFYSPQERKRDR